MKFQTKYKYDKVRGMHFNKPSLTDQSQAYDADINNIVNSMAFSNVQANPPTFGSEFNPNSYNDALNLVTNAKSQFEKLPSKVRREFDNDIGKFVDFIDKAPSKKELAEKGVNLGLFKSSLLDKFESKPTSDSNSEVTVVDTK